MVEDRWLTAEEIADYLNITKSTVYKWIGTRNIPAHKFGNVWKFRRDEIAEWVRSTSTQDRGNENINPSKSVCNMTIRYNTYLNARLNIQWNLWICSKILGQC